jgi:ligand-binding sensor domain-containing protein
MRYGLSKTCILLCLALNYQGFAQQQIFQTYTISDGLVANSVRRIFQDSKGLLWIATWEGLSKYDGHKFTNYTTANGLSHSLVNDIYETKDSKLYIACNNGSIDVIEENKMPKPLATDIAVNRFCIVNKSELFITTDRNGLWQLKNDKFIKPSQAFPGSIYHDVAEWSDSLLVAASPDSFHILNSKLESVPFKKPGLPGVECIFTDSKKRVWLGTYTGLKLLLPAWKKNAPAIFSELPVPFNIPVLKQNSVKDIFEDEGGNMWFATSAGLIKIGSDGLRQVFDEKNGLPSDRVSSIFQDREKNMWIGTMAGLLKLVTKTDIKVYKTESGLADNNISFILPFGKSNMLVATWQSLQVYDISTRQFIVSLPQEEVVFGQVQNSKTLLLTRPHVFFGFDTINLRAGKPVPFTAPPGIACAAIDRFGNIFSGSYGGLHVQPGKTLEPKAPLNMRIDNLLIDRNGYLWAGTFDKGLYRIEYTDSNEKISFSQQQHLLQGRDIRFLYEDRKGNVWVGTRYHGVYMLRTDHAKVRIVQHFHQGTGLTSNWIRSIAEDANGCIWLGFYLGLDKLIPQDTTYRIFNFSRINNYFPSINHLAIDQNNTLWLATSQGLVNIKDGELEKLPAPPVYITSVHSDDSLFTYGRNEKLILSYKQSELQFEFTAPALINEKKIVYSYRLVGSNNARWSIPANEHTVSYASLQPGDYRFEVRTLSWNGNWGDVTNFEFTIQPPFWQYKWFIGCVALITAGVIYWIVKRRIKHIRKEGDLKQKIAESEMMALKAQMNPHFIFNCLSAIDNLVQTDQKDKATVYLNRFAKLIRFALDSSEKNLVPFHKDYESLQHFLQLEAFRYSNKFEYGMHVEPDLLNSDIKVPPLIIQPFVENAIHHGLMNKHSADRKLDIEIALENDHIKYTITDNGIGRQQAAILQEINKPDHISRGMEIAAKRVNLHNYNGMNPAVIVTDIKDKNSPAGTKVEIWLTIN